MSKRLLILGGVAEAAQLAKRAVERFAGRLEVISSLAGRVKNPRPLPGRVRVGGFGGGDGLAHYIVSEKIDLLIDATHPFAANISRNATAACRQTGTPRLILRRPSWPVGEALEVDSFATAAKAASKLGRRAFLSFGHGGLTAFAAMPDMAFVIRVIDRPEEPLPIAGATVITGRPPFSPAGEKALLREHRIDVLVSRNSGGANLPAKITAARELMIPIVLIARPPDEPGERAAGVEDALRWLSLRS